MLIQVKRFDILNQLANLSKSPPGSRFKVSEHPTVMYQRNLQEERERWKSAGFLHSRPAPDAEWLIFNSKLTHEGMANLTDGDWNLDKLNEYVKIPLFEYLIPEYSREVLVQFGLQTAALALSLLPKDREVIQVLLALGNVLDRPDDSTGYQCWVGFAAALSK